MPSPFDSNDWMWARAVEMLGEAERLHRRFFHIAGTERAIAGWEPPVDIFQDEREIVIIVAMPGVPAERVQVSNEGGALVVRGTRPLPASSTGHRVVQLEIPHGAFERRITLPAGPHHMSQPEVIAGCLVLRLTRVDEDRR